MTKQEALRTARKFVTVERSACQGGYTVYFPAVSGDYRGPGEARNYATYRQAQIRAAAEVAHVALHLLDRYSKEAAFAIEDAAYNGPQTTARGMLNAALA